MLTKNPCLTSSSIYDNGNVGIGTSSPSTQLHLSAGPIRINDVDIARYSGKVHILAGLVLGSQSAYNTLQTINTTATVGGLALRPPPSNASSIEMISVKDYTTGTSIFSLMGDGNVGIGTTSPQAKLDINGFMRMSKNTGAPAACTATIDASIAITSLYTTCICKGGTTTWEG